MKSVWQQYTATAEKFNEPGRFTAMIGYEWTSVPGGNNLHRNILFRDNKDKADQIMPFSAWQSEDPEKLWEWMAKYEAEDRRQDAGDSAQRQPVERPHVRAGRLRRQAADARTTPSAAHASRCCRK